MRLSQSRNSVCSNRLSSHSIMPPAREHDDEDAAPPSKRGRYDSTDDVDDVDIAAGIRADIMRLGEQVGVRTTCNSAHQHTLAHSHSPRSLACSTRFILPRGSFPQISVSDIFVAMARVNVCVSCLSCLRSLTQLAFTQSL